MTFHALRNLPSKLFLALVASLVLASCGGGGATGSPTGGGTSLELLPGSGSLYAGVPYTFNVVGGRRPYLITSSEPTLLELNFTLDGNQFTAVPRNPGVVDVGLDPNEVPRRTVNIQVRDGSGVSISNSFNVLQNFFTGYGESYSNTCVGVNGVFPQACSGVDSIIRVAPISQGALYGNRELQFDKIRGDFQFVQEPPGNTPQLLNQVRVRTDQQGVAFIRARVTLNAPTQIASYKITDVATGVTTDALFTIVQQSPPGAITLLPGATITFTGANSAACGFGTSDQYIYDGAPPYIITPPNGVSVTPTTVTTNGDKFTVSVGQGAPANNCPRGTIVIVDSQGRRATIDVNSVVGTTAIPIAVVPATIDYTNGCTINTRQVAVVGGGGPLTVVSTHPRIFGTIAGNTLTAIRALGDGATVYPVTGTLVVTDGATTFSVALTNVPANCP